MAAGTAGDEGGREGGWHFSVVAAPSAARVRSESEKKERRERERENEREREREKGGRKCSVVFSTTAELSTAATRARGNPGGGGRTEAAIVSQKEREEEEREENRAE